MDDAVGDAKALNLANGFFTGFDVSGESAFLPAPTEAATDIVRTTIQHGKRVTVTTYFRDLVETAEHSVDTRIFTPDGGYALSVSRSADGSRFAMLSPDIVVRSGDPVRPRPCRSVRGRYDFAAETVTASFPAACIGKPRWIQVASGATRIQVTPIGDGSINLAGWADDAFRSTLSETSMSRSPKVRRG